MEKYLNFHYSARKKRTTQWALEALKTFLILNHGIKSDALVVLSGPFSCSYLFLVWKEFEKFTFLGFRMCWMSLWCGMSLFSLGVSDNGANFKGVLEWVLFIHLNASADINSSNLDFQASAKSSNFRSVTSQFTH
jgi:hypothetical protein